jgi:hypothetical protein
VAVIRPRNHRTASALWLVAMATTSALAADPGTPPRRGGMAIAVEAGYGGDSLESVSDTRMRAGEGVTPMVGGFYRPLANSPLELYGLAGYDFGLVVPVQGGGGEYYSTLTSPVLEVLANYRFDDKWFVAGGLVSHLNPRLETNNPAYDDIDFSTATGVTVEAGWSFIGVYYTYMRYKSSQADFDASSVGLRFTMRFRKWRPVR